VEAAVDRISLENHLLAKRAEESARWGIPEPYINVAVCGC